jgi:hypothetical protein
MAEATTTDPGCGCCRPEPKTTQDVVRELQARRAQIDARLRQLEMADREPVGAR